MSLPLTDVLTLTPSGILVVDRWLDAMDEARRDAMGGDDGGRVSLDPDDYQ